PWSLRESPGAEAAWGAARGLSWYFSTLCTSPGRSLRAKAQLSSGRCVLTGVLAPFLQGKDSPLRYLNRYVVVLCALALAVPAAVLAKGPGSHGKSGQPHGKAAPHHVNKH